MKRGDFLPAMTLKGAFEQFLSDQDNRVSSTLTELGLV